MIIEKIKLSEIKPYENNAKKHPKEQIEQIKKSIQEFGMCDPIAIDENNVIIEGHGRYIALQQLGYKEVDCIRIENLTEEQKRAYILVHNKLTMNTGFDMEKVEKEIEHVEAQVEEKDTEKDNNKKKESLPSPLKPYKPPVLFFQRLKK